MATSVAPVPAEPSGWTADTDNDPAPVSLPRLSAPVALDGLSGEPAWEAIPPLPVVMTWPEFRGDMTERTEIRIAYDDEYLWAAGRFYDSDPDGIRGNSLYRDRWDGDDAFDLVVDGFNDDETALKFTTTPLGIRLDEEIRNDAEFGGGVRAINSDWNGFWDVAVEVTDDGWFAEMRIPWSTLGFEPTEGRVVMGVIAGRFIARKNEKHLFPAIPPDWAASDVKPSQARDVVLREVDADVPLYVTPYVLTGASRSRQDAVDAGAGSLDTELPREIGLDVRYGLSSNLTLDLTYNTDFSTVESDAEVVNTGRFNLFFPEKRRFFQERSSIFQFVHGDEGRLFHSRRIGLVDGRPVPVLGGVRLAGRLGEWDVGLLDMQVEGDDDAPWQNAAVGRVRRSVLNDRSTVGAMVTSLRDGTGRWDVAGGLDASLNPFGEEYLTLQWAGTANDGARGSVADRSLARLAWERRAVNGLGYSLDVTRSGPAYEPTLGFEARDDFTSLKGRASYGWQPGEGSSVVRHRLFLTGRAFLRNGDGTLESGLMRQRWSTSFRGGGFLNVALNWVYEDLDETLELGDEAEVPPGSYFGPNVFVFYTLGSASDLTMSANLWTGRFLDGWRGFVRLAPSWVLSKHLSAGAEYELHRLWFPSRDQRFDADVARLRLRGALDTHLSADAFLQYNRAADRTSGNLRIRYHFSEGHDLFLVWNEVRDLGTVEDELAAFGRADRRVVLKYSYTFLP